MKKQFTNKERGSALVEYSLLIAGVALVASAAVSIFGHKTTDLIAATSTVLPGAHADDNGAITSGKLIETTSAEDGAIGVNVADIAAQNGQARLGNNLLGTAVNGTGPEGNLLGTLVVEANEEDDS